MIGEDAQGRVIPTAEGLGADHYEPAEAPPSERMERRRLRRRTVTAHHGGSRFRFVETILSRRFSTVAAIRLILVTLFTRPILSDSCGSNPHLTLCRRRRRSCCRRMLARMCRGLHRTGRSGRNCPLSAFTPWPTPLDPRLVSLYERSADRLALVRHRLNEYRLRNGWREVTRHCEGDPCQDGLCQPGEMPVLLRPLSVHGPGPEGG